MDKIAAIAEIIRKHTGTSSAISRIIASEILETITPEVTERLPAPAVVLKESRPRMAPERKPLSSYEDGQPEHWKPSMAGNAVEDEEAARFNRYFAETEDRDEDGEDLQSLMDRDRE